MIKYKIIIRRDQESNWTNWSGTDKEICEAIIDSLSEDLGHGIRTDVWNEIVTNEKLIDFTDEFGACIADFKQRRPLFPDDELPTIGFRGNKKIIINNGEMK